MAGFGRLEGYRLYLFRSKRFQVRLKRDWSHVFVGAVVKRLNAGDGWALWKIWFHLVPFVVLLVEWSWPAEESAEATARKRKKRDTATPPPPPGRETVAVRCVHCHQVDDPFVTDLMKRQSHTCSRCSKETPSPLWAGKEAG